MRLARMTVAALSLGRYRPVFIGSPLSASLYRLAFCSIFGDRFLRPDLCG